MRNILFCLFLSILMPLYSHGEDAAASSVEGDIPSDCDDKLAVALRELIKSDTKGILGLQFKLTTLKMTKRMLGSSNRTIEEAIRKDRTRIEAFVTEDSTTLPALKELFGANAGETHMTNLKERVLELKADAVHASYWQSDKRLSNEDLSTYLMMDKMSNKESEVDNTDIAIAWFMQNVSNEVAKKSKKNSTAYNLTLMSTQLARNLGQTGTTAMTEAEADEQIAAAQTAINEFLAGAVEVIKKDEALKACFRGEGENKKWKGTENCDVNFLSTSLSDFLMNLKDIEPYLASVTRATETMARANTAPVGIQTNAVAGPAKKRKAVRPDPRRQILNESMLAVHNIGSPRRFICPDKKSVPFRTVDLNNGRGNYRMTITVGGRLYTAKRELSPSAQMNCVSRALARQCDSGISTPANCFY